MDPPIPRVCSRVVDERDCGEVAVLHVAWDFDAEGLGTGWICEEHRPDLDAFPHVQVHDLGPDCGMPGARWDMRRNLCRCDDSIEVKHVVLPREIGEVLPLWPTSST